MWLQMSYLCQVDGRRQPILCRLRFFVCEEIRVLGYYALASCSVSLAALPGKFRRNMPDPVPIVMLGRLAVDLTLARQGAGLASSKMRRCVSRLGLNPTLRLVANSEDEESTVVR